jgi:hypothetical protein
MIAKDKGASVLVMLVTAISCCVCLIASALPASAETQWDVGISGGKNGIEGFHLSVGEYYKVPEREVVVVHDRGIHDEELPVVFFLSGRAHGSPEVIVDLRMRGMSWMDITLHYGLSPDIYYVPVREYHEPHGHAWGYYKKHPRHEDWRRIDLGDRDIVDQVNLRFISDHYKYSPDRVMKYRNEGRSYPVIDRDVRNERHGKGGNDSHGKKGYPGEKHGNGNQKGHADKKGHGSQKDHPGKQGHDQKDYKKPGTGHGGKDKGGDYWKETGQGGEGKR